MKRKFICITVVLVLLLCSCRENTHKASDIALECANKAVETIEKYLSFDISYDEAKKVIDRLYDRMDYIHSQDSDVPTYFADFMIHSDILFVSNSLLHDGFYSSTETYNDLKEDLNGLKEDIDKYE